MAINRRVEVETVRRDPATDLEPVYVQKRGGSRFFLGLVLGAALMAGGAALYANEKGSFRTAGASVDRGLTEAEQKSRVATENAGDAIERRTDELAR